MDVGSSEWIASCSIEVEMTLEKHGEVLNVLRAPLNSISERGCSDCEMSGWRWLWLKENVLMTVGRREML